MATVSLCMIVKNEEDVLARCLDSVQPLADEIIITDTGSTDRTVEIARQYTDQIFFFPWIDDFSAARNFSFSKAKMDFCLWLDADDILLEEDLQKLLKLKGSLDPDTDFVMVKYHAAFDEKKRPVFSYYRERLIRNCREFRWKGAIHEAISPSGKIIYSDAAVTHSKIHPGDKERNLRIFEKMREEGKTFEPRETFYYARELYEHRRYHEAVKQFEQFLLDGKGWTENNIEACRCLSCCYYQLGQEQNALLSLIRSLQYDLPRAEICCDIGNHFLKENRYEQASYWYHQALQLPFDERSGGFFLPDCHGFIPLIQLCVCYSRMGNEKLAEEYNELAGKIKPDSPAYLHNRIYFDNLKKALP